MVVARSERALDNVVFFVSVIVEHRCEIGDLVVLGWLSSFTDAGLGLDKLSLFDQNNAKNKHGTQIDDRLVITLTPFIPLSRSEYIPTLGFRFSNELLR